MSSVSSSQTDTSGTYIINMTIHDSVFRSSFAVEQDVLINRSHQITHDTRSWVASRLVPSLVTSLQRSLSDGYAHSAHIAYNAILN